MLYSSDNERGWQQGGGPGLLVVNRSVVNKKSAPEGTLFFMSYDPGVELIVVLKLIVLQSLGLVIGFLILGSGLIVSGQVIVCGGI